MKRIVPRRRGFSLFLSEKEKWVAKSRPRVGSPPWRIAVGPGIRQWRIAHDLARITVVIVGESREERLVEASQFIRA